MKAYIHARGERSALGAYVHTCILLCDTDSLDGCSGAHERWQPLTLLHSAYSDMCSKHHGIVCSLASALFSAVASSSHPRSAMASATSSPSNTSVLDVRNWSCLVAMALCELVRPCSAFVCDYGRYRSLPIRIGPYSPPCWSPRKRTDR